MICGDAPAPSPKPESFGGSMSYKDEFIRCCNVAWDADNANTPGVHWSTDGYVMVVLKQQDAKRLENALRAFPGINGTTPFASKLQRDLRKKLDRVRKK